VDAPHFPRWVVAKPILQRIGMIRTSKATDGYAGRRVEGADLARQARRSGGQQALRPEPTHGVDATEVTVASEKRPSRLGDSPSTPAGPAQAGAVTLGLIAAPDIPEKTAKELASELPTHG
jgi:hypothetical protein